MGAAAPQCRTLPLYNAGSLPARVALSVTHWPTTFCVTPTTLDLELGQGGEVNVTCAPPPVGSISGADKQLTR